MVKIIADSTCDLSDATLKKYDIDMLPLYIHMGENEYKDRLEVTVEDIFKWSDQYNTTPKTSAPSIEDAQNAIIPYMEKNADIIMFAISEDMSTTANVMRLAADNLEYEDHVFVINSESLSTGIGLLVVEAAVMAKKGMEAKEIVDRIELLKPYVRASFVVDTLKYLHRGGRCSATSALVGSVFKIKPRIYVENGKMDAGKKYRGKIEKVILQYVHEMEQDLKTAKRDRVFITQTGCSTEVVKSVKDYLKNLNYFKEIIITNAGGVISSHCGPGTLGVLFIAGGTKFGPYDKQFDTNKNGIMEDDERTEEAAYIRHMVEQENIENSQEDDSDDEYERQYDN